MNDLIKRLRTNPALSDAALRHEAADTIEQQAKRIAELEGEKESIHRGIYHHPDCKYWSWDWRYSWDKTDCNCDDVAGPSEPAL